MGFFELLKTAVDNLETKAKTTKQQAERYAVWRAYKKAGSGPDKKDGFDRHGNVIESIYASNANYVIYFSDTELFYDATDDLLKTTGKLDSKQAHINRLLPQNSADEKAKRRKELELVADAFEMWFCGHREEALETLDDILEILRGNKENRGRLNYQLGSFLCSGLVWVLFLYNYDKMAPAWRPWWWTDVSISDYSENTFRIGFRAMRFQPSSGCAGRSTRPTLSSRRSSA